MEKIKDFWEKDSDLSDSSDEESGQANKTSTENLANLFNYIITTSIQRKKREEEPEPEYDIFENTFMIGTSASFHQSNFANNLLTSNDEDSSPLHSITTPADKKEKKTVFAAKSTAKAPKKSTKSTANKS